MATEINAHLIHYRGKKKKGACQTLVQSYLRRM